jgi:glutamate-1-semialdehyde aminotransferase
MAVGIAVLSYLKEHPEIYVALNGTGEKLRRCLREVVAEEDYPVTIVGEGSIFMARFVPGGVRSVRDLAQENVAAMRGLFPHLAKYGVFIPQAHFALISAAHTDAEVALIAEAYRHSFRDLRAAGLM